MSEQPPRPPEPESDDPGDPVLEDATGLDTGLRELRSRLDALQQSVEQLGSEESWADAEPAPWGDPPAPPPAPGPPELPVGELRYGIAEPVRYAPREEAQLPRPAAPSAPTPPFAPPPPPPTSQARPAPTSSPSPPSPAAITRIDVGPFYGLSELRRFEDSLAALPAVRGVRVHRFGHGRATLEIEVDLAYVLAGELHSLPRELRVRNGPAGMVVDLARELA